MTFNIKQAKKDLEALDKLNLKIKFKDKSSLTELKNILIQVKTLGNNLKNNSGFVFITSFWMQKRTKFAKIFCRKF